MEVKDDLGCICKGNWRKIVSETEDLIDKSFNSNYPHGSVWKLFGIVHGGDDYYYGMWSPETKQFVLASCVGDLEGNGFTLVGEDERKGST